MRPILIASAAAGALLIAGCQRQSNTTATAPAPDATATAPAAGDTATADPATPAAAVQSAAALDQSSAATRYTVKDDAAAVEAAEDPAQGLRLREGARTYFYRPGEDAPYLVRDGDYDYAYRGGKLSGIMDRRGQAVDDKTLAARRAAADSALDHGRDLGRRARQQAPHQGAPGGPAPSGPMPAGQQPAGQGPAGQGGPAPGAADTGAAHAGGGSHGPAADAGAHGRSHDRGAAKSGADDNHNQVSDREDRQRR